MRDVCTRRELADLLVVSPSTIVKLERQERIPVLRISARCVRYVYDDVLDALAGRPRRQLQPS